MYNAHFGFRESPFGVTPDPQFYYSNAVNREAWATLRYGIEERKGFILIAGEAGTGKTTLLRKAMQSFGSNVETAYVSHTLMSGTELLAFILTDLGLPDSAENSAAMIARLYQYAIDQFKNDNIVALLIDEAQDLSLQCLEELRLLGNLETNKEKLLQIVLVGQTELEQKLDRLELRQLKQRIALRCRLEPVKSEEVGAYINSRLRAVGHMSADVFEAQAIERIATYSSGIPRLINILCDNALLIAYSMSKSKVSADMVQEVADDLAIDESRRARAMCTPTSVPPSRAHALLELAAAQQVGSRSPQERRAPKADDQVGEVRKNRFFSGIGLDYSRKSAAAALMLIAIGGLLYSDLRKGSDFGPPVAAPPTLAAAVPLELQSKSAEPVEPDAAVQEVTVAAAVSSPTTPPAQVVPAAATAAPAAEPSVSLTRPEEAVAGPAAEKHVSAQAPTTGETKPESKQSSASRVEEKKQKNANTADFLIIGPSFVRAQPTANAPIIDTLSPGTSINVAGLTGDYYLIRSVGTNPIRGYIHKEDAFFERKR